MKLLKQFGIITALSLVGEILHYLLPLPVPASIYGIVLLFILLETKLIKVEAVKDISTFLIEIMPVMFIPSAVGLLESWDILKENIGIYLVITVVTTAAVMITAGRVTQGVIRRSKETRKETKR